MNFLMLPILVVSLAGCSDPMVKPWDREKTMELANDADQEGLLGTIQRIFSSTIEAVTLDEDLFQQETVPSDILRQEIPTEKLQKFDRDYLKEQAKLLQKQAAKSGISIDQKDNPRPNNIREMGKRFGLSDERIAELEAIAAAKENKNTVSQQAIVNKPQSPQPVSSPGTSAIPFPNQPLDVTKPTTKPVKSSSQGYSIEMQEILNRREDRLRKAQEVNPNP